MKQISQFTAIPKVICFFVFFGVIRIILSVISLNQNETGMIVHMKNTNTNTKRRKPILYIHVGPPKTATTTIQSTLTHHKNELLENSILYVGKSIPREKWVPNFPHPAYCTMYQQFSERSQKITPTCVDVLNQTLVQYYSESVRSIYANDEKEEDEGLKSHKITSTHQKTGQSSVRDIIMSCEVIGIMFSSSGRERERAETALKLFASMVQDWDVRIIIGYRPYFDFVTSEFNEQWEIKPKKRKMNIWPKSGGKRVPLIQSIFDSNGEVKDAWPFSDKMMEVFSREFHNVTVFDITKPSQDGKNLVTYLFCDILESAQKACETIATEEEGERKNVAQPIDYDMLATAAADSYLFNLTKLGRLKVGQMIQKYHENELNLTVQDFPLKCPEEKKTEVLLRLSVAKEVKLFPERYNAEKNDGLNSRAEERLRSIFEQRLDKKAFCNIDVQKVLKDQTWIDFFESL